MRRLSRMQQNGWNTTLTFSASIGQVWREELDELRPFFSKIRAMVKGEFENEEGNRLRYRW